MAGPRRDDTYRLDVLLLDTPPRWLAYCQTLAEARELRDVMAREMTDAQFGIYDLTAAVYVA